MENTRFKRRQTQTTPRKILVDGFVQRPIPAQLAVPAWQPQPGAAKPTAAPHQSDDGRSYSVPVHVGHVAVSTAPQAVPTLQQDQPDYENAALVEPATRPRLRRIDMGLPGDASPEVTAAPIIKHSKWRAVRRWSLRLVITALVLLIAGGGFMFSQGYLKLHQVFKGGTATPAALKANVDPNLLKGEGTGRVNILLLGRGGGTHDAPDLTDTMMLASIDPVNHTATLLSVPRDLWVKVPGYGQMKINAAWETGEFKYLGKASPGSKDPQAIQAGFELTDQAVEDVLGVTIDYNALVDFQAFRQAVDTVGGVSLNVPQTLVDPTMAWENNGNPVLAQAGTQLFDGKHALIYARSRETTSDFARAERQRSLIMAIKDKVENLGIISNPAKLSGLMSSFSDNVQTDISLKDATKMVSVGKAISSNKTLSVSLDGATNSLVTTTSMNGQSIVKPNAGLFQYTAIHSFVRSQLPDPYLLREHAPVAVINGTTVPGTATAFGVSLKTYGYNVTSMSTAPTSGYTQTQVIDLSHGKDPYTKHYLEQHFNTTATTTLPDASLQANGAEFVIIIGSDEATPSQG